MAKKKNNKQKSQKDYVRVVKLDMKGLRDEVIKEIDKLMKGGDTMQFEMKFDRQEGFEFKALKDSKISKFIHGIATFDEDGQIVGNTMTVPSDNYVDGFPQELYDMFDDMKLKI